MCVSAIEALGMSLPYSSSAPANDPQKINECVAAGEAVLNLLQVTNRIVFYV